MLTFKVEPDANVHGHVHYYLYKRAWYGLGWSFVCGGTRELVSDAIKKLSQPTRYYDETGRRLRERHN